MKKINSIIILAVMALSGFIHGNASAQVSPVLECVVENGDGSYTAFYGYNNQSDQAYTIPIGNGNFFTPGNDLGQPTVFEPGRHINVFSFDFISGNYVWTIRTPGGSGRTATASPGSQACSIPSATISGDALLCRPSDKSTVVIDLEGTPPFNFTYQDGDGNEFDVNNFQDKTYTFQTSSLTTFTLLSVQDAFKTGDVDGSATIEMAPEATARFSGLTKGSVNICEGFTTNIEVTFTGTAPYSVTIVRQDEAIEEQIVINNITTDVYTFEAALPGMYYLAAMSDANCEGDVNSSVAVIVEYFDLPTAEISGGGQFCENENASLNLNLTGEAPWQVVYQNPSGENVKIENINSSNYTLDIDQPGEYTLISVEDANCTNEASGTATVNINQAPTATIAGGGDICGEAGGVDVTFTFTGNAPFDIVYTNGQENIEVNNIEDNFYQIEAITAGTYSLVALNDKFCSGTVSGEAEVVKSDFPEVSFIMDQNTFCANDAPVNLEATPDGGSFSGPGVSNAQFDPKEAGVGAHVITYSFTSEQGCTNSASATVNVDALPTATISGGGDICPSSEAATINVNLTGEAPFSFTYAVGENDNTITGINENQYSFTTAEAGTYSLISVSDANGCAGSVSGEAEVIFIDEELDILIVGEESFCEGEMVTLAVTTDAESVSWSTNGKGFIDNINATTINYTPAEGETGDIIFTVTAANKCTSETRDETITIVPFPNASFSYLPDENYLFVAIEFYPVENNADSYTWNFGDGNVSTAKNPVHAFGSVNDFEVTLTVENQGCESSSSVIVSVAEQRVIYVPNMFSPSAADPENRVVKVYGEGISPDNFLFRILNRWGNTLFETTSLDLAQNQGWDGRARNGEMQAIGTYTYIVKGMFLDGVPFEKVGTVTLAR
jgi:hypothetical protein